ncbi:uncharacterized protein LOC134261757 [Saccostrea cucullata]|uniref:uncharacterized protein LOC134261757 n=1 Tax=Saccostrea cuccullata TaxID=36930 RepID=UPI002ED3AB00
MAEFSESSHANGYCQANRSNIIRQSSRSSTETIPPSCSSPSSTENDVPSSTCEWRRSLIEKLGICFERKSPTDIVTEHMSTVAYNLMRDEIKNLEEITDILGSLNNLNHEKLLEINFKGFNFVRPVQEKLRYSVRFKEIDISKYSTYFNKFGVSLWYILKGKQPIISEEKYQCLFEQFLEMFGIDVMAEPEVDTESTEIFQRKVSAKADIVCFSPRDVKKYTLAICEVKKKCPFTDEETGQSPQKFRRTEDSPQRSQSCHLPDGLLAQHVGDLLTYLDKSICKGAILGMTVEKTMVTFTRLSVTDETMEKLQRSHGSVKLKEEERPVLYYSKPYNYLQLEDRKEIVKALLTLIVMEKRRAKKS